MHLFKATVAWNISIPEYAPNQYVYQCSILVFSSLVEKFSSNPNFPKKNGPWNWGMDFLFALITFSIDLFIAQITIVWVYWLL